MMKEITIDEVIEFIVKNSDNEEWMDKLNKITFPFTSKFKRYSEELDRERLEKKLEISQKRSEAGKRHTGNQYTRKPVFADCEPF